MPNPRFGLQDYRSRRVSHVWPADYRSRRVGHANDTHHSAKSSLETIDKTAVHDQAVVGTLVVPRCSPSYFRRRMFAPPSVSDAAIRGSGPWPFYVGGSPNVSLAGSTEMEDSHCRAGARCGSGQHRGSNS